MINHSTTLCFTIETFGLASAAASAIGAVLIGKFLLLAEEKARNAVLESQKKSFSIEERFTSENKDEKVDTAIHINDLFNLYSDQIALYQSQTRTRATVSFVLALVAMVAGFGFVVWGGYHLVNASEYKNLVAGGCLAGIGGTIASFITKTFLDVHKLSLIQLNHYFQQPVINDHVIMAQRLADGSDCEEVKKQAYLSIINSLTKLIDSKSQPPEHK